METPSSKLKVAELRAELQARGLPTAGLKKELVARLDEAMARDGGDGKAQAAEDTPSKPSRGAGAETPVRATRNRMTALKDEEQAATTPKRATRGSTPTVVAKSGAGDATPLKTTAAASPVKSPAKSPVASPKKSPVASPVASPKKSPVASPKKSPVASPAKSLVASPQKSPVASPAKSPVASPKKNPVPSPKKSPVASPVKSPRAGSPKSAREPSPVKSPLPAPAKSPAASPAKSPIASSLRPASPAKPKRNRDDLTDAPEVDTKRVKLHNDAQDNSALVAPDTTVFVKNLVRPFQIASLKEIFAQHGEMTRFWIDSIRTHCYVTLAAAQTAFRAVHNVKWPEVGGKSLFCEYLSNEEADKRIAAEEKRMGTGRPGSGGSAAVGGVMRGPGIRNLFTKATKEAIASSASAVISPTNQEEAGAVEVVGDQLPRPVDLVPAVDIDNLFKKTAAYPPIYYLPLSEEQVAEKRRLREEQNTVAFEQL